MLVAIKTEAMVSVTAKHQETMHAQIQKAVHHKATKLDLRKTKIQKICLKQRATKPCRNQLYSYHLALIAINQIVKMQHGLMKGEAIRVELIATQTVRTGAVAEVVDLSSNQHSQMDSFA